MKTVILKVFIKFFLIMPQVTYGTYQDDFMWFNFTFQHFDSKSKYIGFLEYQPRFQSTPISSGSTIYRGGLGLNTSRHYSLLFGHMVYQQHDSNPYFEKRPFLQLAHRLLFLNSWFDSTLVRWRLENRILQRQQNIMRVRGFLRLQKNISDSWYGVINQELFWNLSSTSAGKDYAGRQVGLNTSAGADQHRFFLGGGKIFRDKSFQIEMGYLNQWIIRPWQENVMNHVILTNLFFNI